MINLYMIRHAESAANLDPSIICGQSAETDLSRLGRVQSLLLGRRIHESGILPDLVYTSPARRARLTARYSLFTAAILEPIRVDSRLHEVSQGDWEGRIRKSVYTDEVTARAIEVGYDFNAPGGESMRQAGERMFGFMDQVACKAQGEDQTVFAYGHGLVTRSAAGLLLGWPHLQAFQTITENTSVTLFRHDGGEWSVPHGVGSLEFEPSQVATIDR